MAATLRALFACGSGRKTLILLGLARSFVVKHHWKKLPQNSGKPRPSIIFFSSFDLIFLTYLQLHFLQDQARSLQKHPLLLSTLLTTPPRDIPQKASRLERSLCSHSSSLLNLTYLIPHLEPLLW
jgi:hypothetical protein